ncbi:hypothetical protein SASPL_137040 [Salvia splendens]|uniref:Myb/SANT-like domain-containing protein n=1 Tax=Salvia splendens TaxID=180675 RepID=A0A8X8WR19_SALSN|nr:uncharacterized protein LOC121764934 [Salvia splendens]KAG6400215.1 hypothetical protein SASPL_137040 [Salvia splendens]
MSSNRTATDSNGCPQAGWNGLARNKFRKGDRTRRMWVVREEEILVSSLLELVARGWKSDNGFRAGYQQKVEDDIRKEFPNSDIKGNPHISSKITAWKKNYNSLRDILSRSGVGFNVNNDYKIDIDDDQWAQVVAADKDAKFMRYKSWPYWEAWQCIFGKDRAKGSGSENIDVAATSQRAQMASASQTNENDYHPTFEDFLGDEIPPNSSGTADKQNSSEAQSGQQQAVSTTKSGGQKRKQPSSDDALMEFLGNLHAQTNSRLETISSRIGYEFDMGKARQEVFDKLGSVDGLTLKQRYYLCNILSDKPQRMEVFMGMPMNAKLGYLLLLLDEERPSV